MSNEQSAGELMVFGLVDQADRLAKSAKATQEMLAERIEDLAHMETQVTAAVQSIHVAVKNLEAERAKLAGERTKLAVLNPTLEKNATWAMRETLREQGGQIKYEMRQEVREALMEPLEDIRKGAVHVRQNIRDTKWLISSVVLLIGILLGFGAGQYRVRTGQIRLETQMDAIQESINVIEGYLQRQDDQKKTGTHPGKGK